MAAITVHTSEADTGKEGCVSGKSVQSKERNVKAVGTACWVLEQPNFGGVDKVGNRHFTRTEEIDGIMKEKRWVVFKGEEDPTSLPVEWICWLNGQRKRAPTPEELIEMEARRELVKQNVARKTGGPDLKSFIRKFPTASEG
ncbi:hypothetical protein DKX38_028295 [Salix brachista]|uniref:NADH dehydrogenase [ubiquinone] 1 alpha subcomplex subunit 12 n=1 Tax=Salix brachista TaxID=2182728 RepID=A0A5N5J569_9ROSI|nr:hypothetical protein DKX38_028295 [Salix brachista]